MCSARFPDRACWVGASLSSAGSSEASSPASTVLSRRYDILPSVPPHFVSFAWRYLSFHSLPGGRVCRRGLELSTRYLRPGLSRGDGGISQVPGEPPLSVCACSSDAGRTACTRPVAVRQRGPWYVNSKG